MKNIRDKVKDVFSADNLAPAIITIYAVAIGVIIAMGVHYVPHDARLYQNSDKNKIEYSDSRD